MKIWIKPTDSDLILTDKLSSFHGFDWIFNEFQRFRFPSYCLEGLYLV